jgi:hypothetical protein
LKDGGDFQISESFTVLVVSAMTKLKVTEDRNRLLSQRDRIRNKELLRQCQPNLHARGTHVISNEALATETWRYNQFIWCSGNVPTKLKKPKHCGVTNTSDVEEMPLPVITLLERWARGWMIGVLGFDS